MTPKNRNRRFVRRSRPQPQRMPAGRRVAAAPRIIMDGWIIKTKGSVRRSGPPSHVVSFESLQIVLKFRLNFSLATIQMGYLAVARPWNFPL